jgi:thioredoxin-like negative regulator of GroEL
MAKNKLTKVTSINDLRRRAEKDPKYMQLAITAAKNLGGDVDNLDRAIRFLEINANETDDEQGVVDEVNFCLDLIK